MKKLTLVLFTAAITTAGFSQKGDGDYDGTKANVVKLNILSPIVRSGTFAYERKISDKQSVQLGGGFTGYRSGETKFSGFHITPEFRFYVSKANPAVSGFYMAPFLRYSNYDLTDDNDKATLSSFGGGLVIGRQWIFSNIIALDVFLGPSYTSGDVKVISGTDNYDVPGAINGFGLRLGINVGVAF